MTRIVPRASMVVAALLVAAIPLAPADADALSAGEWAVGVAPGAWPAVADHLAQLGVRAVHAAPAAGFAIVRAPDAGSVASLAHAPGIRYLVPDEPMVLATVRTTPAPDALAHAQWALAAVNASAAWRLAGDAPRPVLALVDTGADLAHADLAGAFWRGNAQHGASFADPFGLVKLTPTGPYATTLDLDGHGTAVAGVAGATRGNGLGIRGVADAPLMIVKTGGLGAPSTAGAVAAGIAWAVDHGARVVSISQVASGDHPALRDAVAYAEAKGAVVVAAAGNDGRANRYFPAAYGTVLSVAAVDEADRVADFSSHGKVDLAAPGVQVLTTQVGNAYGLWDGTSLATPHVSAAAALVLAAAPDLTPAAVRAVLNATARDVAAPGFDARTGHGVLDAGSAVSLALGQRNA